MAVATIQFQKSDSCHEHLPDNMQCLPMLMLHHRFCFSIHWRLQNQFKQCKTDRESERVGRKLKIKRKQIEIESCDPNESSTKKTIMYKKKSPSSLCNAIKAFNMFCFVSLGDSLMTFFFYSHAPSSSISATRRKKMRNEPIDTKINYISQFFRWNILCHWRTNKRRKKNDWNKSPNKKNHNKIFLYSLLLQGIDFTF